jgi:hypothetical protein
VVENDMGKDRAEEKCELERETGFEPATLALARHLKCNNSNDLYISCLASTRRFFQHLANRPSI